MRRRHLLALVVLALVVATVLAVGPVRVWDWLTLRTVEEHWPNGQMRLRYSLRLWESSDDWSYRRPGVGRGDYDEWYENGQQYLEQRNGGYREWSETGRDVLCMNPGAGTGIVTVLKNGRVSQQTRLKDAAPVETRTSPPWFSEQEILQAFDGVEE